VVESTYNWYWLVDGLMEKGYRLHLANTAAIQQYNGLKYTDDHSDARWLAHLLRLMNELKKLLLARFKAEATPGEAHYGKFYFLVRAINRALA